jgi:hypothetical protein
MAYSIVDLRSFGFRGFETLRTWNKKQVLDTHHQDVEGIYVVARESVPTFMGDDHHRTRPRVWTANEAAERWVCGVQTLYFGKGPLRAPRRSTRKGLANRVAELQAHGYGNGSQHYGGKLLWQIDGKDDFLVGWKVLHEGQSAQIESGLIRGFELTMGQ